MTDWSADPWFAQHAWVAPRVGETRRSGFKSLRPHSTSTGRRKRTAKLQNPAQGSNPRERIDEGFLWSSKIVRLRPPSCPVRSQTGALTHGSHNTRGSLPAWEKPVDQGSNPCVPTPRPRDVGKEPPSSKTQRKGPIRGSALTKASCGRAKLCGHGHPDDQFKRRAPRALPVRSFRG